MEDKFRIIELTTESGKKKYKPQKLAIFSVKGFWRMKEKQKWVGIIIEPNNKYFANYGCNENRDLIFDTIKEAKTAVNECTINIKKARNTYADLNIVSEKIIEL